MHGISEWASVVEVTDNLSWHDKLFLQLSKTPRAKNKKRARITHSIRYSEVSRIVRKEEEDKEE